MKIQQVANGQRVALFLLSKSIRARVLYHGATSADGAVPRLGIYIDGHKATELTVPGQNVLVEGHQLEVESTGGAAVVGLDTTPDASPAPTPGPGPSPAPTPPSPAPTPSGSAKVTATIQNQSTEIKATGGKNIKVSGVVTIAPAAFLPGQAFLSVQVSKHGQITDAGGESSAIVDTTLDTIEFETGLVRPEHVLDIVLTVIASDGTTAVATKTIKTTS